MILCNNGKFDVTQKFVAGNRTEACNINPTVEWPKFMFGCCLKTLLVLVLIHQILLMQQLEYFTELYIFVGFVLPNKLGKEVVVSYLCIYSYQASISISNVVVGMV